MQEAAKQLPGNERIETVLGMCFYGTGKYKDAIPHLEFAQSQNQKNRELNFVIAQAYLWSGQYEKAKVAFQGMLARDPDSPQVQILLGEAYDGLGRTEEAISAFRKATAKGEIPDAHFGLGFLLWKTHRYQDAATEFKSELTVDSKNYKAAAYLGDCELELGNASAAQRHLQDSIGMRDVLWIAHFDLGKIEAGQKRYEPAKKEYQRAIQLDPDRPEAHYRVAQVYQVLGQPAEARKELETVTRLHEKRNDDLIVKVSGSTGQGH